MYRESGQWEEAFRVARAKGSAKESAALALEWALSVGPEVGGKLLSRHGMAEECISLACDQEMVYSRKIPHKKLNPKFLIFVNFSLNLPWAWLKR